MTKKNVKKVEPAGTSGYVQVGDSPNGDPPAMTSNWSSTWIPTGVGSPSRVSHVRRAIFQTIEYFKDLVEDDEFDLAFTELDNLNALLNSIQALHEADNSDYDD